MDEATLAKKILRWRELEIERLEIEDEIKEAVMERGKTVVLGGVRARFNKPRKSYDYETPGRAAPPDIIDKHTQTVMTTDWRAVCKEIGVSGIVSATGSSSVTIRPEE